MFSFLSINMVIISLAVLAVIILLIILFLVRVAAKYGPKSNQTVALASAAPSLIHLDSLKQSFKRAVDLVENHLAERSERYNLPWSLVINCGTVNKELPLLSSGLQSALSSDSSVSASVDGISWNFFDKGLAVQLQSSHLGGSENYANQSSWDDFLGLCRNYRPDRPFDSLIISVPAYMLLDDGQSQTESLIALAKILNKRFWLAQNRFALQFPVYLVVDGCEYIPGFSRFAGALPVPLQRSILGWSNPNELSAPFQSKWIDMGMENIISYLSDACTELSALEDSSKNSAEYFLLPSEINKIRAGLHVFFEEFMRPSVYHEPFMFRGFYLCGDSADSAVFLSKKAGQLPQLEGNTPIINQEVRPAVEPVFLRDLFERKIFAELGLVRSSSKQKLRRSPLSLATTWGAGILAVCWVLSITFAAFRINFVTEDLLNVITQFNIESKEAMRAGIQDSHDPEKSKVRALKVLRTLDTLNAGALWSFALPGSWPVIDNLNLHVQQRIEEGFAQTAMDPVRIGLNSAVSAATGVPLDTATGSLQSSTVCILPKSFFDTNLNKNLKAVNYEEHSEFELMQKFVARSAELQEAINAYTRLSDQKLPPNGEDLRFLVQVLFGVELNGNTNQIAAIFKSTHKDTKAVDIASLQKNISCTYGLIFDSFIDSLLNNNNLLSAEIQYSNLLNDLNSESNSGFDGAQGIRAWESLATHMSEESLLLQAGKGAWIANRAPQLGDNFDRFIKATKSIPLIGAKSVDAGLARFKTSFQEFLTNWDSQNTENAASAVSNLEWSSKEGRWVFSKDRKALKDALSNLLTQPYLKNIESRAIPQLSSNSLVLWDRQKIEQALSYEESKRIFDTETVLTFPAQIRVPLSHFVYGALAAKVIDSAAKAITISTRPSGNNFSQDLNRTQLPKLVSLLNDLEANEAADALTGIILKDGIARLKILDDQFNQANLFVPRDTEFKGWSGGGNPIAIAYELSDIDSLNSYVARQIDYIEGLTKEADLLLPMLTSLQPNNSLVQRWNVLSLSVARKKLKSPTSSLGNLTQFILESGIDLNKTNCGEKLIKVSSSSREFDVFSLRLESLQSGMIKRCMSLRAIDRRSSWDQFVATFNGDISGRSPFKANSPVTNVSSQSLIRSESPAADFDDVIAILASYDKAHKALEDSLNSPALSNSPNKNSSKINLEDIPIAVKKFDEQFLKVRKLLDPLIPAKEGTALGYDLSVEFRVNSADEIEGSKIIEWSLNSGNQKINAQDKIKSLFWQPGDPISLNLRVAKDSPLIPKSDSSQPDLTVNDRLVTYSFNDPWALFSFMLTHVEPDRLNRPDSRTQLLRFEFPMSAQPKNGIPSGGPDTKARVFVRFGLSPVGKKSLLNWPSSFPVKAPEWTSVIEKRTYE